MPQKRWRVRVVRMQEDWVEVEAGSTKEAEELAAVVPGVKFVMAGYTMSAEKPVNPYVPMIVEEDDGY